jgi:hypothetical protein
VTSQEVLTLLHDFARSPLLLTFAVGVWGYLALGTSVLLFSPFAPDANADLCACEDGMIALDQPPGFTNASLPIWRHWASMGLPSSRQSID